LVSGQIGQAIALAAVYGASGAWLPEASPQQNSLPETPAW
jgi:hypothetical protein